MIEYVNWGILGTGNMARAFATSVRHAPGARLLAVGSRSHEPAKQFADKYGVPRAYSSYESLVNDRDVDVAYVATPHVFHLEHMLLALDAGKAVLCEKPFTINAQEARLAVQTARRASLFLMEAMWTRFLPAIVKARALLRMGAIGEPRILYADFGFRTEVNPQGRLFSRELGGGALLDVGVYPISLASLLFGQPASLVSLAQLGVTGVDEQCAMIASYPGGELAVLSAAIRAETQQEAIIVGTEGRLIIQSPWWRATVLTLSRSQHDDERIELPFDGNGYQFQIQEVVQCLRHGLTESAVMPLDESVQIMEVMDSIRARWGLQYRNDAPQQR